MGGGGAEMDYWGKDISLIAKRGTSQCKVHTFLSPQARQRENSQIIDSKISRLPHISNLGLEERV